MVNNITKIFCFIDENDVYVSKSLIGLLLLISNKYNIVNSYIVKLLNGENKLIVIKELNDLGVNDSFTIIEIFVDLTMNKSNLIHKNINNYKTLNSNSHHSILYQEALLLKEKEDIIIEKTKYILNF